MQGAPGLPVLLPLPLHPHHHPQRRTKQARLFCASGREGRVRVGGRGGGSLFCDEQVQGRPKASLGQPNPKRKGVVARAQGPQPCCAGRSRVLAHARVRRSVQRTFAWSLSRAGQWPAQATHTAQKRAWGRVREGNRVGVCCAGGRTGVPAHARARPESPQSCACTASRAGQWPALATHTAQNRASGRARGGNGVGACCAGGRRGMHAHTRARRQ